MTIERIEAVTYAVDDLDECSRFFTDFGLDLEHRDDDGAVFTTRVGQRIVLRRVGDPSLPTPIEDGPGIREVVWGVDSDESLQALIADLKTDRDVVVDDNGVAHTVDNTGWGVGLAVQQPIAAEAYARPMNATGDVSRWNVSVTNVGPVKPIRVCHVALNIPKEGREKAWSFYLDRLNFRATDIVKPMGVFMQIEGDADQHNFLLCHRPDKVGTNHTSYEVSGFDDVVEHGNWMLSQGWREARRLGRHTVGSNVFRFLHAPMGGRVEIAADMDRVDETYGPNVYEETPPHHIWVLESNRDREPSAMPAAPDATEGDHT
jgi:catechol 2,3-dioxygenase-like lactoylglutathione lyase family enzyme